ncbi:hypothetical protein [Rhizobium sp. PL01]|uniref:hypothetical protein n=1 Tax=Rhizobium sp. PL01 TaxID=3085631 RepID=UPI002980DC22|nr:hypothetical protein [Rhizobium sp. PL01]MDW5313356.1 hypothetical protein [Rhizobium sp. PL01]
MTDSSKPSTTMLCGHVDVELPDGTVIKGNWETEDAPLLKYLVAIPMADGRYVAWDEFPVIATFQPDDGSHFLPVTTEHGIIFEMPMHCALQSDDLETYHPAIGVGFDTAQGWIDDLDRRSQP